jgi:hypothetical protein
MTRSAGREWAGQRPIDLKCVAAALVLYCAMAAAHCQAPNDAAGPDDETFGSCLASGVDLYRFTTPEKTWAYHLQALREGDRRAVLSTLLAGQIKKALSSLLDTMSAEQMRAMADSYISLKPLPGFDANADLREYLLTRKTAKEPAAFIVTFEFHATCGGWRIATM